MFRKLFSDFTRRQTRLNLLILLLFILLTFIFTYPQATCLGSCVTNSGDPLLNTWILAWDVRAFFNDPAHIFDANIFYPHANTLAYSESQFANALQAIPVLLLSQNPILANNFIVLFSFVMSGFGMYLLVKHLTGSALGGVAAGIIFAFTPYRFTHLRIQLVATHWMPFALLFFDKMIRRQKWTDFLWFGLFYNLTVLTSYYYAIFFTVGLVVLGAGYLVVEGRQVLTKRFVVASVGVVLVTAVINIPLSKPYFELEELGLARSQEITDQFKLEFSDLLVAAPNNLLYGRWGEPFRGDNWSEHTAFPGITAVGLAIFAFIVRKKRRGREGEVHAAYREWKTAYIYLALLVVTFILAMGASFVIPFTEIHAPLPFGWLFEHVPGFKALRAPVRFIIVTIMALAVLSGYGVARLQMRWRGRRLPGLILPVVLIVFMAIEYLSVPIPLTARAPKQTPEVYSWLAQTDEGAVLIELPFPATAEGGVDYARWPYREGWRLYYATQHWRPMVNGYSGFLPPGQEHVLTDMLYFPDEQSIGRLNELGVRYVVVHTDEFDEEQRRQFEERIGLYAADLRQAAVFGSDLVFETRLLGGDEVRQLLRNCSFDGKMELIGFNVDKTAAAPGDLVTLSLLWRGLSDMSQDYTIFVHLVDGDGRLLAQHDAQPQAKPTSAWLPHEVILTQHPLTLPADALEEDARLIIGLYTWPSLDRLPMTCQQAASGDTITLTDIAIQPSP